MSTQLLFFITLIVGITSLQASHQTVTPTEQKENPKSSQEEVKEFFAAVYRPTSHHKIFELIQKYGANIANAKSSDGDNILRQAASSYSSWSNEEFERLLQVPDIDKNATWITSTPLTVAINDDQLKKIELLIKYGADLNLPGGFGFTPLMYAAREDKPEAVRLLLRAGARTGGAVTGGFYVGKTFYDLAKEKPAVQKILVDFEEQHKKTLQGIAQKVLESGLQGSEALAEDLAETVVQEIQRPKVWPKTTRERAAKQKASENKR